MSLLTTWNMLMATLGIIMVTWGIIMIDWGIQTANGGIIKPPVATPIPLAASQMPQMTAL